MKMPKLIIVITLMFVAVSVAGTGQWWDHHLELGGITSNLRDVDRLDGSTWVYACGDNGTLLYSSYLGYAWGAFGSPTGNNFYCISLPVTGTAYAGGAGVLYKLESGSWNSKSLPSGMSSIRGIDFIDASNGWSCGGSYIAQTTNGGSSWSSFNAGGGNEFYDIAMHSASYGLAVDSGGRIFRWNGSSWTNTDTVSSSLRAVTLSGTNHAWAVGVGGTIYSSSDGGLNWIQRTSGTTSSLNDVRAYEDSGTYYVYAVGNNGVGLYSNNGGSSWNHMSNRQVSNAIYAICPPNDASNFCVVGARGLSAITSTGTGWAGISLLGNSIYGVASTGNHPATVVAVGEYGLIMYSTNHGYYWYYGGTGVDETLRDVEYSGGTFVACGDGNAVYSSTNGSSWSDASGNLPSYNWRGISAVNSSIWYLSGQNLGIYRTDNSGGSWSQETSGSSYYFNDISMLDDNNGWAVGDSVGGMPVVYRKSGGGGWTQFTSGIQSSANPILSVDFEATNYAWMCGEGGQVYSTHHGSGSWVKINGLANVDYSSVDFMDTTEGWLVGDDGYVYHSTNGGNSYSQETNPAQNGSYDLYGVTFHPDGDHGNGWAVGQQLLRMLYDDEESPVELTDFSATNDDEGIRLSWIIDGDHLGCNLYRAEGNDIVLADWHKLNNGLLTDTSANWLDVEVQPETCYRYYLEVIESGGGIQHFGPVEVRRPSSEHSLALEVAWPCPAASGSSLSIAFTLPEATTVELTVYDLSGRRVATLLNENRAAGRHETIWDTAAITPGVYLYRLATPEGTLSQRLVLTR